jgi:hypothetical protein
VWSAHFNWSSADGFDLGAVKPVKYFPQQLAMFFEQREGELIIAL